MEIELDPLMVPARDKVAAVALLTKHEPDGHRWEMPTESSGRRR